MVFVVACVAAAYDAIQGNLSCFIRGILLLHTVVIAQL